MRDIAALLALSQKTKFAASYDEFFLIELENHMSANQTKKGAMPHWHALPLLLGMLLTSTVTVVNAQSDAMKAETPLTREQVKRDRDEFIRTHRWDTATDNWVLKAGVEPPTGMKSRAEVKAERDAFLREHRYDIKSDSWIPLETTSKSQSTLTRAQVKEETRQFLRTHRWDDNSSSWVEHESRMKK